jgi:hypothetical protein
MQPNYPAPQQYPPATPPPPSGYPAPQYPPNSYAGPGYGAPAMYPAGPGYPGQYPVAQGYPAPPAQPSAPGSLDGFYGQPSAAGGPSFKFQNKPMGTTYAGVVARPITDADVRQQTNNAGVPQTYKDGRPKFILVVPMLVQQSAEFPEGQAGWWVKGQARDELVRAMAEAGAPAGPPEAGAMIAVTLVGQRQIPNMNPQYLYRIVYTRPTGAPAQAVPAAPPASVPAHPYGDSQPPAGQPYPPMAPAQPVYAAPPAQYVPQMPPAPAQPAYAVQAAPPAQYASAAAVPAAQAMHAVAQGVPAPVAQAPGLGGLTPEQQALMAQLTGASA